MGSKLPLAGRSVLMQDGRKWWNAVRVTVEMMMMMQSIHYSNIFFHQGGGGGGIDTDLVVMRAPSDLLKEQWLPVKLSN